MAGPTRSLLESEATVSGQESTTRLVRSIASDTAELVRKEVELARHELVEAILARLKAAGAMVVAGVAAIIGVIYLGAGAAHALGGVVADWAAWLIVGGGFMLVAGFAVAFGLVRAKQPPLKPERTVETVKEDLEWARAQLKR